MASFNVSQNISTNIYSGALNQDTTLKAWVDEVEQKIINFAKLAEEKVIFDRKNLIDQLEKYTWTVQKDSDGWFLHFDSVLNILFVSVDDFLYKFSKSGTGLEEKYYKQLVEKLIEYEKFKQ